MNKADINHGCRFVEMAKYNFPSGTELELWETEADRQHVSELFKAYGLGADDMLVAFGLSASAPFKQWPVAFYGELMHKLRSKWYDLRFVLLGDAIERGADMVDDAGVLNFCGQLTLRETTALLRHTTLYVGNDTGLMHIASACGCAIVEVSSFSKEGDMACGISSTSRFSPWSEDAIIVQPVRQLDACKGMCQMPYAHCITQVTVETVSDAAYKLLAARGVKGA